MHLNPTLIRLLEKFRLAKKFIRGRGHYLFDPDGREYLDFTAQYGALPFGYNPPDLWQVLHRAQTDELPSLVQPSLPVAALELADLLARHAPPGLTITTFTQSGAEAVEAAIKLARSSTKKPKIISTVDGFHGKTLGALSATGRPKYQKPFGAPAPDFETIPFDDLEALEATLRQGHDKIAAFIVEPVQGEAGVRLAAPGYLKRAEELCRKHGVLLIVDEIQTGLGRIGSLWACEVDDVRPDIMTIGKALGGGLFPLSACLCTEAVWNDDFGRLHSSTFANNNLACAVGQAVLQRMIAEDRALIRRADQAGRRLLDSCQQLRRKFPQVIKEVRGAGLLAALEFHDVTAADSFHMAFLCRIGGFPALLAGYLLNVEGIRVLPFLNHDNSLRLEPSLTIEDAEVDRAVDALGRLCHMLECRDYGALHEYLVVERPERRSPVSYRSTRGAVSTPRNHARPDAGRFAFLIHYTGLGEVFVDLPGLRQLPASVQKGLWEWFSEGGEVAELFFLPSMTSKTGAACQGWLICVPLTSEQMMARPRAEVLSILREAVLKAKELGAEIVGLGAFTSVVSRGGADLVGNGVAITSGNSLTVAVTVEALLKAARDVGMDIRSAKAAVVGANGSIGRACARLLLDHVPNLVLVGNPTPADINLRRLGTFQQELQREWPAAALTSTIDVTEGLREADLVIVASAALAPIIFPGDFRSGAVVCDLTRPGNISARIHDERQDVLVFEGGLAQLPEPVTFGTNFGFSPGATFACLAETIVLALEQSYRDASIGVLDLEEIRHISALAEKHGVQAGPLYVNGRELTAMEIETVKKKLANEARWSTSPAPPE